MRPKLLLIFAFAFSNAFCQNTNTSFETINSKFYSDNNNLIKVGKQEGFHDQNEMLLTERKFINKTGKSNLLERHRLWLNMTNDGGAFKQLLVGYIEGATNGFDSDFDGLSLDANPYIDFYSINSGKNLVIQGRQLPFTDVDQVVLGYRTAVEGSFTISIEKADGLLTHQAVFIEDKITKTVHNLKVSPYTFQTSLGTFKDRFILRYSNTSLSSNDFEEHKNLVSVWIEKEKINITSSLVEIDKVFIYNSSGSLLYRNDSMSTTVIPDIEPKNNLLLIKVVSKDNQITTKKIIY